MPDRSEAERLQALRDLHVLDTPPEPLFDALARAAALEFGVPISLLSLVDAERQWFKAVTGLEVSETPRGVSMCTHAIRGDDILVIRDTTLDPRFVDNPLVTGPPFVRFYAGAPLRLANGARVGTLCVVDSSPREPTPTQLDVLRQLAKAATIALEQRRSALDDSRQAQGDARLAQIIEATGAGTWEWNVQTGETRYNQRWAQMLGRSVDSLGATTIETWSTLVHPEDLARSRALLARHFSGETPTFECETRMLHSDGRWIWVLDRGRVITRTLAGEPEWMFGTHVDITEMKQVTSALSQSDWLLRRTGEIAHVGGWVIDLSAGVQRWTHQTCEIHGVPAGYEPTLDEAISFFAPEAQPVIRAAVYKAVASGCGWDLELPLIRADGERIWVRGVGHVETVDGSPVQLIGALQDITERVEQRLALERATERMLLANESAGIGVWELDARAGTLLWDDRMFVLYGLSPTPGRQPYTIWTDRVHPEDRADVERQLAAALAGGEPFDTQFRVVWPDGSVHIVAANGRVHFGADGAALSLVGVNRDVTEQRRLELALVDDRARLERLSDELADQHELMRVTLESIADAVITTDRDGVVMWMNPVAERLTGWTSAAATGRELDEVFPIVDERTQQRAPNPVTALLEEHSIDVMAHPLTLVSLDGAQYGIETSTAPIRSTTGETLGVVLVFHDVTEQRRLSSEMTYRATHDTLTGLVNRAEFEARLRLALEGAQQAAERHALLYIDLDQFKLVNDTCGHTIGDQLLVQVAGLLGETVRASDTLARLGGDEFAVILQHCSIDHASRVAQKICDRMDAFRFVHNQRSFRIGTSIGLVPVDHHFPNATALLQAADKSCYAAKEAGRSRVHAWFDSDEALRHRQGETQWATRLAEALDQDHFELLGQRIFPLRDGPDPGRIEVLLRLVLPNGEYASPAAFLPAAERFGLSTRIDVWVLRRVLRELAEAPAGGPRDLLCVNLSGKSVGDRAFQRLACELLDAAPAGVCNRLCFEISEASAVANPADTRNFLVSLHGRGVLVALNDFGAGASTFGYLKQLPVDILKIDARFVRNLLDDALDEAAARSFVDVASILGAVTVAEQVERPEVLARLREMGIDLAQGFLLHRPVPLGALLTRSVEGADEAEHAPAALPEL